MPATLVDVMRAALAERSGVRLALLFGSRARGRERADSDVDVAVDAPGVDLLALQADLSRAVGIEVDLVDLRAAGIPLLDEIVRAGVPIFEDEPGRLATFRSHALASLEIDRPWYARMRDAFLARLAASAPGPTDGGAGR